MSLQKKAQLKKQKEFKGAYPDGRKKFAQAKKKAGIRGATKHKEVFKRL